jgi:hypothetical protein
MTVQAPKKSALDVIHTYLDIKKFNQIKLEKGEFKPAGWFGRAVKPADAAPCLIGLLKQLDPKNCTVDLLKKVFDKFQNHIISSRMKADAVFFKMYLQFREDLGGLEPAEEVKKPAVIEAPVSAAAVPPAVIVEAIPVSATGAVLAQDKEPEVKADKAPPAAIAVV